jgi:glycosyltransferase involved in cell wall biosynthesis
MMSAIPVTVETVHGELAKKMLFDPYDINQIVEKIEWALDNTEELLTDQNLLYSEMKNRTWNDVGEEYISVFEKVCQPKV